MIYILTWRDMPCLLLSDYALPAKIVQIKRTTFITVCNFFCFYLTEYLLLLFDVVLNLTLYTEFSPVMSRACDTHCFLIYPFFLWVGGGMEGAGNQCIMQRTIDVARWPIDVAKWPTDVAKWPIDVAKWPINVAKWPIDVAKWPVNVAKWPIDVAKWPVEVDTWPTDAIKL